MEELGGLHVPGLQASIAKALGVSRATISRDVQKLYCLTPQPYGGSFG